MRDKFEDYVFKNRGDISPFEIISTRYACEALAEG